MLTLLAQQSFWSRPWSWPDLFIAIIIVGACIGIVLVALRVFGLSIPEWAKQIFWIVVVCCVAILAIRFVASL